MKNEKNGMLYVVATPIGNLSDITLRAIDVLKQVTRVVAEDTRHAGSLLKHFSIQKPMLSLHEHNERDKVDLMLKLLTAGESIALVSDAGTPLISDPGYHLVKAAREAGFTITPIPGPSAAIAALSVAGLPTDKFIFEGFLPAKALARENYLQQLLTETRTLVFYEAPHRLLSTLESLKKIFGEERKATIARELTKLHETILTQSLGQLVDLISHQKAPVRGEIVLIVSGSTESKSTSQMLNTEHILATLLKALPLKQAVALAAEMTGERKNELYKKALALAQS